MKDLLSRTNIFIPIIFSIISLYIGISHAYPFVVFPDSALYLSQAKSFMHGEIAFTFMGGEPKVLQPLFPLLAAIISFFTSNLEYSGTLLSIISGSLMVFPLYYLSLSIFDKNSALISLVLVVLDPILINFNIIPMTEALFTLLFVLLILMCRKIHGNRSWLYFALIGFIIGLAYLTRVIGIVLLTVPLFWIVVYNFRKKMVADIILPVVFLCAGFLVSVLPYWILLHHVFNQWQISGFYGGALENISQVHPSVSSSYGSGAITAVLQKSLFSAKNFITIFFPTISLATIIFIFFILLKKWNREELLKSGYLFSWVCVFFIFTTIFPPSTPDNFIRYLVPILPILFLFSGHGIVLLGRFILGIVRKYSGIKPYITKTAYMSTVFLVLFFSYIPEYNKVKGFVFFRWFSKQIPTFPPQIAGERIKKVLPFNSKLISRKPFVPYYADSIWFPISGKTTLHDVYKIAVGGSFIYIDLMDNVRTPHLSFLLDPARIPERFTPIMWNLNSGTGRYDFILYYIKS